MYKMIFAALMICATPALAESRSVSVAVSHSDLDLSTAAGVEELDRRISRAARKACGPASREFSGTRSYGSCVAGAVSGAAPARRVAIASAGQSRQMASAAQ